MNKQDYEKAKAEFWADFNREHPYAGIITEKAFLYAFDRAYALGKQDKDAEGEEMLTVPRKKVQEMWQRAYKQESQYSRTQDSSVAREELYYNRGIMSIIDTLFGSKCLPDESASEVASETKSETDKHFDNILKGSFHNERRLNIAAQLVCAMIPKFKDNGDGIGLSVLNETDMIKCAYRLADYLIAECERSEKLKGE